MSEIEFTQLALAAGHELHVVNAGEMSRGETFFLHDVPCALRYSPERASAFLRCELGDPRPDCAEAVFRQLLELQPMLFGSMDAMFAHDPVGERLLFLVRVPLEDGVSAPGFAEFLSRLALQVREWQQGVLDGQLIDYDAEFAKLAGGMTPSQAVKAQA
jgi:hypothetical protein